MVNQLQSGPMYLGSVWFIIQSILHTLHMEHQVFKASLYPPLVCLFVSVSRLFKSSNAAWSPIYRLHKTMFHLAIEWWLMGLALCGTRLHVVLSLDHPLMLLLHWTETLYLMCTITVCITVCNNCIMICVIILWWLLPILIFLPIRKVLNQCLILIDVTSTLW